MAAGDDLEAKVTRWREALAPHVRPAPPLDWDRAALLVIDPQVQFSAMLEPILPNLRSVIDAFRSRRRPVVFTRHRHLDPAADAGMLGEWWDAVLIDGSPEAELIPQLRPQPEDLLIEKDRYSAFLRTRLDRELSSRYIRDLVVGGVMTNLCCETTARDAFMRDFRVFFLLDGTATCREEYHLASLRNLAYGFAYLVACSEILPDR